MSKAIKQLLVAAAVIAISLVFIIQFQPGASPDSLKVSSIRCAVEVDGDCVAYSDYVAAYRLVSPARMDEEQLASLRLDQVVVDGLIERYVLLREAERLGIAASGEEVSRNIATTGSVRFSLPADKEDVYPMMLNRAIGGGMLPPPYGPARMVPIVDPKSSKFDYERYQTWVQRRSGKTEQDFKEYQQDELVAARVRQLVRSQVHVGEREARLKFDRNNEKVIAEYVAFSSGYFERYALDTSSEAVTAWASSNAGTIDEEWEKRKDTFEPSCRQARHLLVRIDATIPDKEEAKAAARAAAEKAKARIEGGASFAEVARDVSEDLNSAADGGTLGCFAAGKLDAPATDTKIDEAAQALEPGETSEPIETTFGFHLVQVERVVEGDDATELGRTTIAREQYLEKEADRLAAEAGKAVLASIKSGKTIQEAIDAHLGSVLRGDGKTDYARGRAAAAVAEGDGEGEGGGAATEDEATAGAGDDDDAPPARDAWNDEERPQPRTSSPFTRRAPPFAAIEDPPAAARSLHELAKPGDAVGDIIKLVEGYAVATLEARKPVTDEEWDEKRDPEMQRILREKQRDALIAYVQRLKQKYAQEVTIYVGAKASDKAGAAPSATATAPGSGS
ncbi:MAG: peptidylprolyl isomerase [Myxococcota bacterium]